MTNHAFSVTRYMTGLSEPASINLDLNLLNWTMSLPWWSWRSSPFVDMTSPLPWLQRAAPCIWKRSSSTLLRS